MNESLSKIFRAHKEVAVITFLLIFAVILFFYASFQQNNISNMRFLMSESEKIAVDAQANKIEEELNNIDNDLDFLSESPAFKKYVNGEGTKDSLQEEWVVFVNSMKKYDKLRYIDWRGNEIVRINFNNDHAQKVEDALLENQSNRYYFTEAFAHGAGERYVSKMDLEAEGAGENVSELPYKHIIRAAITVFDAQNNKQGIIILDYLGKDALDDIKNASTSIRHMQLVNGSGDFLAGPRKEHELASIYTGHSSKSFKNDFPEEWNRITTIKNGQFFNKEGIFTFRSLKATATVHINVNGEDNVVKDQVSKPLGFVISQISTNAEPFANDSNGYLLSLVNAFHTPLLLLGMIIFSLLFTFLVVIYQENRMKTRIMLTYDKLTGCINRAFGMRIIEAEINRAERHKRHLSLILMDIDHFKKVNDTFGHMVGDIVLKSIADIVKGIVRKSDSFIRLGGEEFLILLPETDEVSATKVAENIRSIMEKHVHPLVGFVTVSCGVSERMQGEKFPYWYLRLDDALYTAKRGGRNKVVVTSDKDLSTFDANSLSWKHEWESGNKEIDEQHKNILEIGNKLIRLSISEANNEEIVGYFDILLEDISMHFNYEEKMLADLSYMQYEEHTNIHKELIVKAKYLREQYLSGEVKPTDLFSFIVSDIILGHMLSEDVKFFSLLKNKKFDGN